MRKAMVFVAGAMVALAGAYCGMALIFWLGPLTPYVITLAFVCFCGGMAALDLFGAKINSTKDQR